MVRVNCHVHTIESDGAISPREVLERAEKEGISHLCFTDHFKVPSEVRDYGDKRGHSNEYYEELYSLREEFKGRIDVMIGLELDWIDGYEDWFINKLGDRRYDFLLGSVHHVRLRNGSFCRDGSFRKEWSSRDYEIFIRDYFVEVQKMIRFGMIDSVAHLDGFRKGLEDDSILEAEWYRELVRETLELMKERSVCLELNASGWWRLEEQFPMSWIIEEAVRMGVEFTVGNDFHRLEFCDVSSGLDRAIGVLKGFGCEEIIIFKGRERVPFRI